MRQLLHFVTFEGSPPQLLLLLELLLSLRLHFIILPPLHFHLFIFCTCSTIPLHSIKIKNTTIYCIALYLAFQDHLLDLLDLFTLQVHLKRRVSLHLFRLPWLTSPNNHSLASHSRCNTHLHFAPASQGSRAFALQDTHPPASQ